MNLLGLPMKFGPCSLYEGSQYRKALQDGSDPIGDQPANK